MCLNTHYPLFNLGYFYSIFINFKEKKVFLQQLKQKDFDLK